MSRRTTSLAFLLACAACAEVEERPDWLDADDDPSTFDPAQGGSECGAPVGGIAMTLTGLVLDPRGAPAQGALVTLQDRARVPGVELGSATTAADGTFRFEATDITDWPGCWMTVANYPLVVELGDWRDERLVNRQLWDALKDGTYEVDLTRSPLRLSQ